MKRIMFVCKRNSCRSQMAEGYARTLGAGVIEVVSSGLESSRVHPTAVQVMAEAGVDITSQTSKPLSDFGSEDFDAVISLCGCGVNLPEAWLTRDVFEDWRVEDPDGQPIEVFHRVREEIKQRVQNLVNALREQPAISA
ncbi:arsenate reductase, glutathione/glutaredoxin type [Gloeobacter morelensis]|uniref:Arsenate reductase, glutathione/glutaredoxin type n=1 Tax=Gloeobacter morelensis MG652769 TaxID=2781736 RepID=A0ABY3PTX2_9CYAN|nr:arsenate reductase, glutathione/glutaredoxin type [Gloeobacter morelensis]UFP96974.1 arsenate reductase, glutathione/glutaredoxin type [Gloeobacter morelensis MG652769]